MMACLSLYQFDMFKLFVSICLLVGVLATLQVYSPTCAASRFDKPIEYTLSNFGDIPYGQTLIGQIYLPSKIKLCTLQGETYINNKDPTIKTVLLVERGQCKFTEKVINAQNLGADVIIIYDNEPVDSLSVIMKNDGHGHLADIPSLFVTNAVGLKLKTADKVCSLPVVKIAFEMDQAEISQVTLWLDANNRESYILARDFYKNDYFRILDPFINLDIQFRVQTTCKDWICSKQDCVGVLSQKYCRNVIKPDTPDVPYAKGSDLIYEQLRQHFLWQSLKSGSEHVKWWKYMTTFDHKICILKEDIKDCSQQIMREVGVSEDIIKKVHSQTDEAVKKAINKEDSILRSASQKAIQLGIIFYPEATINNRNFYGLFKAPEVFEAICQSLLSPPKQCTTFIKNNHQIDTRDQSSGIWGTILLILLLMTLGFILALFIYTRVIRKQVNQQLSLQVNKMVQNYVTLADKNKTGSSYSKFDS